MGEVRKRKPIKLRRGGDMHAVLVYMVGARAFGDRWADPDIVCAQMTRSVRVKAVQRLVEKMWLLHIGGMAQITTEGLKALEKAS